MKNILISLIGVTLFVGCVTKEPTPIIAERTPTQLQEIKPIKEHIIKQRKLPPTPKKKIKLKKVEDTNYNEHYMYPEDTKAAKKDPIVKKNKTVATTSSVMTKEACISMISQEKFDKYTAMFGSEAASIKRCTMLKAMRK